MHPLINQQLAKHHSQELQREADAVRFAAQAGEPENRSHLNFLRFWYDRTRFLYRRPLVPEAIHAEVMNLEELKPALVATFSVMHDVGLVSEYNDQFVEKFVQTLERELAHQYACKSS